MRSLEVAHGWITGGAVDNAAHLNGGQRYTRDSLASLYRSVFANLQRQEVVPDAPTITVLGRDAAVYSTRDASSRRRKPERLSPQTPRGRSSGSG